MAEQPSDAVLRILQLIQQVQAEHGRQLEALPRIERRLDDIQRSVVTAPGLAAHANDRHDQAGEREDRLAQKLEDLQRRVEALEEKV